MQSCGGCFSNGVQPQYISATVGVHNHATACVVGGGNHGDGLFADIDTKFFGAGHHVGEVALQKLFWFVGDVEKYAVCPQALHFMVYRTRHNVSWSELPTLVKAMHETAAVG